MSLNIVKEVLIEELERVMHMQKLYLQEYESGPKGSLFIENNKYIYLIHRIGKKVKKDYLGTIQSIDVNLIKQEIDKNKKNKSIYKELLLDEKKLRKAIKCL